MAALTLVTGTLAADVPAGAGRLPVSSTAGINVGDRVFVDLELYQVLQVISTTSLRVMSGLGTLSTAHINGATFWAGNPSVFRSVNPQGIPPAAPMANPWINVATGTVWFALGDESGPGVSARFWQQQVVGPRTAGALGILQPVDPIPQ